MAKIRRVQVYFFSVKNIETKRMLTRDELKTLFQEISELEYSRGEANSMLRDLGETWYACDVGWTTQQPLAQQDRLHFMGSRVRDEDLPRLRFDKETWDDLRKPANADLMEVSYGVFYFPAELTHGCVLFLLKNHHGMSMTRIQQYVKNIYPRYNASQTTVTKGVQVQETIQAVHDLRYIILDHKKISPSIEEGIGDFHDRAMNPDDLANTYDAARIKLDVREMPGTPVEKMRQVFRDFTGNARMSEARLREFVDASNTKLTAVKVGQTKQEDVDLTKNLYAFEYTTPTNHVDAGAFYQFCDRQYGRAATRRELISLARGVANINNDHHEVEAPNDPQDGD